MLKSRDYVPVFSIHDAVKDGRTLAQLIHSIGEWLFVCLAVFLFVCVFVRIYVFVASCLCYFKTLHMLLNG